MPKEWPFFFFFHWISSSWSGCCKTGLGRKRISPPWSICYFISVWFCIDQFLLWGWPYHLSFHTHHVKSYQIKSKHITPIQSAGITILLPLKAKDRKITFVLSFTLSNYRYTQLLSSEIFFTSLPHPPFHLSSSVPVESLILTLSGRHSAAGELIFWPMVSLLFGTLCPPPLVSLL